MATDKCPLCGEKIKEEWMICNIKGTPGGVRGYCSKLCADRDSWGPNFNKSYSRRVTKK